MNTKLLMSSSALLMGGVGLALTFVPQEAATYLRGDTPSSIEAIFLQIAGALYFAFAMTNWTARANLIGGIYGRPIAIGNLCHFAIAALALVKGFSVNQSTVLLVPTMVYSLFAIAFAYVFFTHPVKS